MSELCNSKNHFLSLLISDFIYICCFILSHPLYFSYFIFFSPYIIKLISFLSPLFITTFLLLLAIITELTHNRATQFLATHSSSVLQILLSKRDGDNEEILCFEDLELYKVVFGELKENQVGIFLEEENPLQPSESTSIANKVEEKPSEENPLQPSESTSIANKVEEISVLVPKIENSIPELMGEKRMDNFLKILDEFERMSSSNVEEKKKKKVEPLTSTRTDKVVENNKGSYGSKATDYNSKIKAHSQRVSSNFDYTNENVENSPKFGYNNNLSTYGSMRKEKEWRRTLACKLFEERHNVDGGEGMDSLWETYENDSIKPKSMNEKIKKKKKNEIEVDEVYGYGEDDEINGQLCCLQALKLSAGKMNLGIGRPNLVKFSKAIKGFGWLHHVSKNNKKVHNNGDRYY